MSTGASPHPTSPESGRGAVRRFCHSLIGSAGLSATSAPPGTRAAGWAWAGLCGLTAAVHLGGLYMARDLRAHLPAQLGLWLLAGLVWLLALGALRRATPLVLGSAAARRAVWFLWAVALLMRLPAVTLPLGHSDDVYRYLWDGAVQQAGHSPYAGPPDDPEYAAVRAAHPELHRLINHRHLPTIYPPAAQLLFRAHATLTDWGKSAARPLARLRERPGEGEVPSSATATSPSPPSVASGRDNLALDRRAALASAVRLWKALVVAADLLVLALLISLLRQRGRDVRWATVWGVAPLPAIELGGNGHLESFGVLPLMLALWLWQRVEATPSAPRGGKPPQSVGAESGPPATRWRLALLGVIGALMALAVLVKPVAGAALPAMLRLPRRARVVGGALLVGLLVVLPYGPRGALPPSLGEYGRRWRSNEGAYAGLQAMTQVAVERVYRPPYYEPWHWTRLARALTGRDRDTVWPDELAGALARSLVLVALGGLTVFGLRRRLAPAALALVLLLGYQLLTPVLHPWYELWPLALGALWPPLLLPVVLMAALAPLGYLPLADYFAGHGFHEAAWPRLVQHGAGWGALLFLLVQRRRPARPSAVPNQGPD